jgi:hypothetical protein
MCFSLQAALYSHNGPSQFHRVIDCRTISLFSLFASFSLFEKEKKARTGITHPGWI